MKFTLPSLVAFAIGLALLGLAYCSGRLRFLILNSHARIELNGVRVQGEVLERRSTALVTIREAGKRHSYQLFFEGDTDFKGDMGFVVDCGRWVAPHLPVLPETRNYPPCPGFIDGRPPTKRWPLMDEGKSMRFISQDQSTVKIEQRCW